jgi:hypothetical protein
MESGYRPYASESEAESDSDSEYMSDASIESVVSDRFRNLTYGKSMLATAKETLAKTLITHPFFDTATSYDNYTVDPTRKPITYGSTKFATSARGVASQIIAQSQDRDRAAYPNPTNFTIKLPRPYRNVTNIDLANMNFLNTLLFFRDSRENTYYNFIETGRPKPDFEVFPTITTTDSNDPYILRGKIREGSYNINDLQTELLYTLNTAPTFFYYPDGFTDFAPIFAASGSYALIFNSPGDYYFDSLTDQFITVATIDQIVLKYFSTVDAGQTRYTNNDILVAYYYPVIKEAFLNPTEYIKLNKAVTNSLLLPGEDLISRVIYNFQGLQDLIILELIALNRTELDLYRNKHTYLAFPINNYAIRENKYNKHLVFSTSGLAKSIKTSIETKSYLIRQAQLNSAVDSNGDPITEAYYNSLALSNRNDLAAISEMRDFLFSRMANHFGVQFNSYDVKQLFTSDALFNIQNGIGACNVVETYTSTSNIELAPDYSARQASPPILFKNMSNLDPKLGSSYDINEINGGCNLNIMVDTEAAMFNPTPSFSFIQNTTPNTVGVATTIITNNTDRYKNDILNINPKKRSIDLIARVEPSKYSIFKFKSPCRQTIQVQTLPLPHKFRYENYNTITYGTQYGSTLNRQYTWEIPSVTDLSGRTFDYETVIGNHALTNAIQIPSYHVAGSNVGYEQGVEGFLSVINNRVFYKFTAPLDENTVTNINISLQGLSGEILPADLVLSYYGDKAAFVVDSEIAFTTGITESPTRYLATIADGFKNQITLSNISVRGGDTYYIILRASTANFTNTAYRIYTWYTDITLTRKIKSNIVGSSSTIPFYLQDPESNANMYKDDINQSTVKDYFQVYDRAYLKLPYASNLYSGTDPTDNAFNDPLIPTKYALGYDSNGVSTDLTDYRGIPIGDNIYNSQDAIYQSTIRYDPYSGYLFNVGNDFDAANNTYLYSNNQILNPLSNTPYIPTPISKTEYKIVHWNDSHYLPPLRDDPIYVPATSNFSSNMTPYLCNIAYKKDDPVDDNDPPLNYYYLDGQRAKEDYIIRHPLYNNQETVTFGNGVSGYGFLPADGEWEVNSFMFKSAYHDQATDPNKRIAFIGIFDTTSVVGYNIDNISLSNAACVLSNDRNRYITSNIYDKQLGAYHFYKKISSADSPFKYNERNLAGYTRNPKFAYEFVHDKAWYSAVPFDASGNILTYYMSAGSPIANNQLFTDLFRGIIAKKSYMSDGSYELNPGSIPGFLPNYDYVTNNRVPSYIKPVEYTEMSNLLFQSKYEQSMPIITPKIQLRRPLLQVEDTLALKEYKAPTLIPNVDAIYKIGYLVSSEGTMTAAFVNEFDPLIVYRYTLQQEIQNGEIIRKTLPRNIINYRTVLLNADPSIYNPATEIAVNWTENNKYVYVFVYGKHPILGVNDYKILRIDGGDDINESSTVSIFLNYADLPSLNGTFYSGPPISDIDISYNITFNVSFQYNDNRSASEIIRFSFGRIGYPNNVYIFDWDTGQEGPKFQKKRPICVQIINKSQLISPVQTDPNTFSTIWAIKDNNNDILVYNMRYLKYDISENNIVYTEVPINVEYIANNVKATAYDFKIKPLSRTSSDVYNTDIYYLDSNDLYHLHRVNKNLNYSPFRTEYKETQASPETYSMTFTYRYDYFKHPDQASAYSLPYSINEGFSWGFGMNDEIFTKWTVGTEIQENPWEIYANIAKGNDTSRRLSSLMQVFYPTMKIGLIKKKESYNPMTDAKLLTNSIIDQTVITPQWPRSQIFLYSNFADLRKDLGEATDYEYGHSDLDSDYNKLGIYKYNNNTKPFKWGYESNYVKADSEYGGYYFNGYVYNMEITDNIAGYDNYYVAIRGSLPTEGYQTLVRINCPNRLDFGFMTIDTLINEITGSTPNKNSYNPDYLTRIKAFNDEFALTRVAFGDGIYSNYSGALVTTTSNLHYFSNFYKELSNIYTRYENNTTLVNTIDSNVNTEIKTYLGKYWSDILPSYALERERITDPVTFSPLFYSSTPDTLKTADDEWGLGWNLGFPKEDLPAATVHFATSIYKIFFETVFLRLGDYQGNMNIIAKTGRENSSITNEPQGQTNQYFAKLLLNSFGNYSSTTFQNPPSFNPPIGRLDKLQFQWINPNGTIIDNAECDWSAVLRITEQVDIATTESTIVNK